MPGLKDKHFRQREEDGQADQLQNRRRPVSEWGSGRRGVGQLALAFYPSWLGSLWRALNRRENCSVFSICRDKVTTGAKADPKPFCF